MNMAKEFDLDKRSDELSSIRKRTQQMAKRAGEIAGELEGREGAKQLHKEAQKIEAALSKVDNIAAA
jgi:hypothetical protein